MTTRWGSLWKAGICALSLVVVILGACVKPPVREMSEAQRTLDEARAKGADAYATELYFKAESSFKEAKSLVAERSYEKARKLAETVSKLALQAAVMAETNKASLKEETERIITEAEKGISDIKAWTPPKSVKRRFERLLASREAELQAWETDLGRIKAKLTEEKIQEAKLEARRVLGEVAARMRTLQAIPISGAKGRR